MFRVKHILVPVDFSVRCSAAANHAVYLAKHFDAKLTFLHVIDRPVRERMELQSHYGDRSEIISAKESGSRLAKRLHEFVVNAVQDVPVQELLVEGDPAREIESLVQTEQADLLVIPTRGRGVFRTFLLGSVAGKILHDVTRPVFTGVHVEDAAPFRSQSYRRIGCAIDLADDSERILRWAGEFADAWNADLVLIHATPLVEIHADSVYLVAVEWRDMLNAAAEDKASKLAAKLGYKAELCFGSGHPVQFVTSSATERKVDVLIIGRGLAAQRGSHLPTHAYGIIRGSPCPVISLA